MVTRRTLVLGGLGAGIAGSLGSLSSCTRQKAKGFSDMLSSRIRTAARSRRWISKCSPWHGTSEWKVRRRQCWPVRCIRKSMRLHPRMARCTRSAPTISPFLTSYRSVELPWKCGCRLPVTRSMSSANGRSNWCASVWVARAILCSWPGHFPYRTIRPASISRPTEIRWPSVLAPHPPLRS